MSDHELLTVEELASKLKVPESWIYSKTRKRGDGTIPTLRVGKYLRFDFDEVKEWLQNKSTA